MSDCYCRGQAVCPNCNKHSCADCWCDDTDQTKEATQ